MGRGSLTSLFRGTVCIGSVNGASIASGVNSIISVSGMSNAGGIEHYTAATSTCTLYASLLITYGKSRNQLFFCRFLVSLTWKLSQPSD